MDCSLIPGKNYFRRYFTAVVSSWDWQIRNLFSIVYCRLLHERFFTVCWRKGRAQRLPHTLLRSGDCARFWGALRDRLFPRLFSELELPHTLQRCCGHRKIGARPQEAAEHLLRIWRLHTVPTRDITLSDFSKEKAPCSGIVRDALYLEEE